MYPNSPLSPAGCNTPLILKLDNKSTQQIYRNYVQQASNIYLKTNYSTNYSAHIINIHNPSPCPAHKFFTMTGLTEGNNAFKQGYPTTQATTSLCCRVILLYYLRNPSQQVCHLKTKTHHSANYKNNSTKLEPSLYTCYQFTTFSGLTETSPSYLQCYPAKSADHLIESQLHYSTSPLSPSGYNTSLIIPRDIDPLQPYRNPTQQASNLHITNNQCAIYSSHTTNTYNFS